MTQIYFGRRLQFLHCLYSAGVLEKFIDDEEKVEMVRNIFTGLYSLDKVIFISTINTLIFAFFSTEIEEKHICQEFFPFTGPTLILLLT